MNGESGLQNAMGELQVERTSECLYLLISDLFISIKPQASTSFNTAANGKSEF